MAGSQLPAQLGFEPLTQGALLLALVMLLGRAMVGPLFAQSAWNNVTFTAGEVRDPGRNLPRALLWGCVLVVGLYLLANLAYIVTLPLAGNSERTPEQSCYRNHAGHSWPAWNNPDGGCNHDFNLRLATTG
jgi:amino acid transporter